MSNVNDMFPSNYLKASDLNGSEVVVTIDHVTSEPVGQKRELKPILYFKGKDKGLVLNKTNAKKVQELSGSAQTEDWDGFKIKLFPTETEFGGETVDCIRIKAVANRPAAKPIPKPLAPDVDELDEDSIPF